MPPHALDRSTTEAHRSMIEIRQEAPSLLKRWFALHAERPEILDASRYLLLGPDLAATLLLPEPETDHLAELLRTLRDKEPKIFALVLPLARVTPFAEKILAELALDQLLAADSDWPHPSLVLDSPRPPYRSLLAACEERLRENRDEGLRPLFESALEKLARASRIADEAAKNRERLRGRRKKR